MSTRSLCYVLLGCWVMYCSTGSAKPRKPLNNLAASDYEYYRNKVSSMPWFQAQYDLDRPLNFGFAVSLLAMDARILTSSTAQNGQAYANVDVSKVSPSLGMHAVMDWRLHERWSLRMLLGPSFGSRKVSFYDATAQQVELHEVESVLLEMPVLVKYKAVRTGNNRPYFIGGCTPYLDFSAGKKNADGFFIERKPVDLRIDFGFGMDFYRPYYKFATEFRCSFGLTNIFKDNSDRFLNDPMALKKIQSVSGMYSNLFILTFLFE